MSAPGPVRFIVGVVPTVLVLAAIGWGSRAPYDAPGSEIALLRFSWRMQSAESQVCRDRTQAELDELPAHMRTPQVCESRPLVYRLESSIDGREADVRLVRAAGARGDRPLVVWEEIPLTPGAHRVSIRFLRDGGDGSERIEYEGTVEAVPGRIVLVTLDAAGRLVAR